MLVLGRSGYVGGTRANAGSSYPVPRPSSLASERYGRPREYVTTERSLSVSSKEELADWNARVRRLARDYDKKYRPVVLVIGYKTNLATESTLVRVSKIAAATARYTDDRKPLSERQVQRIMAEMIKHGAMKVEERWGTTGRQRSSVRILNVRVSIRFGKPVEHPWDAPLPPVLYSSGAQGIPDVTPDVTPITISSLPKNYPLTNSPGCAGEEDRIVDEPGKKERLAPSAYAGAPATVAGHGDNPPERTYLVRRYRSGKLAYARLDRASRLGAKGVASDTTHVISEAEDAWMWRRWPAESPERPEIRQARIDFLSAGRNRRKAMMEEPVKEVQEDPGYDPDPSIRPDDERSPYNVFYLWRARSGDLALFCAADRDFDPNKVPRKAVALHLSPQAGVWFYETWASWGGAGTVEDRAMLLAREFCTDDELATLGIARHIAECDAGEADAGHQDMTPDEIRSLFTGSVRAKRCATDEPGNDPSIAREEFDALLGGCPASFREHWGGAMTIRDAFGYWTRMPDVGRLRADIARHVAEHDSRATA